jgi:transcriptional regulator with XRE-family HTH domain
MGQGIKHSTCIGRNIRKTRTEKGMTQEQLAAKLQVMDCDMSRGTLAKIEAGIRHISIDEINAIKKVLDMRYEDFFQ